MESKLSRIDKVTRILSLYHELTNGHKVNKEMFCMENGVSKRGFERDIQDIRLYLCDSFSTTDIIYDKENNSYEMSVNQPQYMDKFDAAIIVKLILSAKVLRKDEAEALIENLLQNVTSADRKAILNYLKPDILGYTGNHNNAVVKLLSDLYRVIDSGNDIRVAYFIDEQRPDENLSPVKIVCDNGRFYLTAAKDYSLSKIEEINCDKIRSFTILKTFYAKDIKTKYEEEYENGKNG